MRGAAKHAVRAPRERRLHCAEERSNHRHCATASDVSRAPCPPLAGHCQKINFRPWFTATISAVVVPYSQVPLSHLHLGWLCCCRWIPAGHTSLRAMQPTHPPPQHRFTKACNSSEALLAENDAFQGRAFGAGVTGWAFDCILGRCGHLSACEGQAPAYKLTQVLSSSWVRLEQEWLFHVLSKTAIILLLISRNYVPQRDWVCCEQS